MKKKQLESLKEVKVKESCFVEDIQTTISEIEAQGESAANQFERPRLKSSTI